MKKLILVSVFTAVLAFPLYTSYAQTESEENRDYGRAAYAPEDQTDGEVHGTEALEMISQRMKELTGSLEAMPEIPQLNQTIMLPGVDPNFPEKKKIEKSENESEPQQEGERP